MRLALNDQHTRLALSVASGVGGQFVSLLAPLVLMPAMLAYLGDEAFGIWAASIAITGVTAFLDLGVGSGLLSRISEAFGRADYPAIRRYIASGYMVLIALCLVGLTALAAATLVGVGGFFSSPETWPITLTVLAIFLVNMPAALIYRVLQALLRIPLQNLLQVCGSIGAIVACLSAIHLEAAPWIVITAYGATPVVVMLFASLLFFGANSPLRPRFTDFSFRGARELVGFGSYFFILSILTAIGTNVDIPIISHIAGPETVANFVPPMRLGAVMAVFIGQLFMPLWSFNGEALARGDVAWVRRTTLLMSIGGATLVAICGLSVTALSHDIMMLWMHRTFAGQEAVLLAMTAASTAVALTSPYNMVLNAKGHAKQQVLPWLIFVITSLSLKFWLLSAAATWLAPAITFVCYLLFVTPAMILQARRILNMA